MINKIFNEILSYLIIFIVTINGCLILYNIYIHRNLAVGLIFLIAFFSIIEMLAVAVYIFKLIDYIEKKK